LRVSVIVTTFNRPFHLRRALEGLRTQTRLPDQVVVADDGSDEPTGRLIRRFAAVAPFPVVHARQEHDGFRAARNRNQGAAAADGEYIIFLDGDCTPSRHFVADHLRLARPGRFIQGHYIRVSEKAWRRINGREGCCRLLKLRFTGGINKWRAALRLPGWSWRRNTSRRALAGNLALFRADFLAVNGFDERFVGWGDEDRELVDRLQRAGLRRRDASWSAYVFHLWHPPADRSRKDDNFRLFQALHDGPTFTPYGIVRAEPAASSAAPASSTPTPADPAEPARAVDAPQPSSRQ
jgi:glycosyltransferase involved in cell wall biosynthesis